MIIAQLTRWSKHTFSENNAQKRNNIYHQPKSKSRQQIKGQAQLVQLFDKTHQHQGRKYI